MMNRVAKFKMPGSLIMGVGSISQLGDAVQLLKGRKVLIVADPGVVRAGLVDKAKAVLADKNLDVEIFDGVEPDPRVEIVGECADKARAWGAEVLLGLGGGSSLDIAKVAAIVAKHGGPVLKYVGIGNTPGRGLATILVPTTAGTGSEVTPIAVLSDEQEKLKKGIVSDDLYPDASIVDPGLMVTVPPTVTAYTGMDTLAHAAEAYTNRFAIPFVDTFALESIRLVGAFLRRAVCNGSDLEARSGMALASTYGGMCLGSVNTAAAHALAYPLGGTYHVPHGVATSLLLPHVMAFNLPGSLPKYAAIATALGERVDGLSLRVAAESSVHAVKQLIADIGIPRTLRELKIPAEAIPEMAEAALKVTRLLNNNPRTVRLEDIRSIFEQAY